MAEQVLTQFRRDKTLRKECIQFTPRCTNTRSAKPSPPGISRYIVYMSLAEQYASASTHESEFSSLYFGIDVYFMCTFPIISDTFPLLRARVYSKSSSELWIASITFSNLMSSMEIINCSCTSLQRNLQKINQKLWGNKNTKRNIYRIISGKH